MDKQKTSRGGGGRSWRYRYKFDEAPTKVHFSLPEKLYVHPDTKAQQPWRTGTRYFVPWGGKSHKGIFIEVDPNGKSVIEAYRNPVQYGLDVPPSDALRKLDPQRYFAVAGWVEEWFHWVEGTSEKSGKTYHERERCTGRGCKLCQANAPKVFGKKVYFEVARTHWNESLFGLNEDIETYCHCGGRIYATHYECPKCRFMLVDMTNQCDKCRSSEVAINQEGTEATCKKCQNSWSLSLEQNKEISELVHKEGECSNCHEQVQPAAVTVCTNCQKPDPYNLFDCQMSIQMVQSADGKFKELRVDGVQIQEPDARLFDPKFAGMGNPADAAKITEANRKPLDLNTLLAPVSLDEEAQMLEVQNPFNPRGGGPTALKAYNRGAVAGQQESEYEGVDESGAAPTPEVAEESAVIRQPPPKGPTIARIGARR